MKSMCGSVRPLAVVVCAAALLLPLGCRPSDPARLVPADQYVQLSELVNRSRAVRSGSATVEGVEYVAFRYKPSDEVRTALLVSGKVDTTEQPLGSAPDAVACLYTPSGASYQQVTSMTAGQFTIIYPIHDPERDTTSEGTHVLDIATSVADQMVYLDLRRKLWSLEDGGVGRPIVDRRSEGPLYEEVYVIDRMVLRKLVE